MKRCLLLSALGLLLLQGQANAQQSLTSSNVVAYDFTDFTAAGFTPTPAAGQLDSDEWIATRVLGIDLDFGDTSANADFANGPSVGGETEGGVWAFSPIDAVCGSGTQTMLGVQPSNMTFSPGAFQLRIQNNTGAALNEVFLQYAFAWFNDASRSMAHTVQVLQVDSDGVTTGSFAVPALAAETPIDADQVPAWDGQCQSAVIDLSSIPIADGDNFVIVFDVDDGDGSGTRDEIAFGEVQVAAMALSDAGPIIDVDAGVADASVGDEADAASGNVDAGASSASDSGVGGEPDDGSDSGCGCSSGQGSSQAPLSVFLFALVVLGLRRRREYS
jgi:MYXO-CTERM domain-containing protein